MEVLKKISLLLLFCSAAAMIVRFLLPSGRISQTAKGAISVVLLFCTLSPLFSLSLQQTAPRFELPAETPEIGYDELFFSAVEHTLRQQIARAVDGYTNAPYQIVASVHIGEDRSIQIEQVRILFDCVLEKPDALLEALTSALGFEPVLVYREVA